MSPHHVSERTFSCRCEVMLALRNGQPEWDLEEAFVLPCASVTTFFRPFPDCRSKHFSLMRVALPRRCTLSLMHSACTPH